MNRNMVNLLFRLSVLAFFFGINIVLGARFLDEANLILPKPIVSFLTSRGLLNEQQVRVQKSMQDYKHDLSADTLLVEINTIRTASGNELLSTDPELTAVAQRILEQVVANDYDFESLQENTVLEELLADTDFEYQWVKQSALVGPLTVSAVLDSWQDETASNEALSSEDATHIGLATTVIDSASMGKIGLVVQLLGREQAQNQRALQPQVQVVPTQLSFPDISDQEVINALNDYRQTHGLYAYTVDEKLCSYAQKRVGDLVANGQLDGHEGFRNDFADPTSRPPQLAEYSGSLIGENLAHQYCRNMQTGDSFIAETGTALIEWCFDSSTKGHREAQLSTEFRNVCVRHGEHMYVVIFGS